MQACTAATSVTSILLSLLLNSASPVHYYQVVSMQGADTCPSTSTTEAIMKIRSGIDTFIRNSYSNIGSSVFDSCNNISAEYPSGYYNLRNNITGDSVLKFCDMNRTSCCAGQKGGWMRVANIDMTNPNQQCPPGLENWIHPNNASFNHRLCDRTSRDWITNANDYPSCNSTTFPVDGVQYS